MMSRITIGGGSSTAMYVQAQLAGQRSFLHESAALGAEQVLRDELAQTWEECSLPGWDGYDALPVQWDTYLQARSFLLSLPLGMPLPSIGAEPDGQITLEWHRAPRRTLSVSIAPDEQLHYAALLGPARVCGTEAFFGEAPARILRLIRDIDAC